MLFGLHRLDLSGMKTAWVVAGIMFLVIAVVGVATRLVALACGSSSFAVGDGVVDFLAVAELRSWTISSPTAVDSFAVNVLQVFVVWLLFKLFTITRHNLRFEPL